RFDRRGFAAGGPDFSPSGGAVVAPYFCHPSGPKRLQCQSDCRFVRPSLPQFHWALCPRQPAPAPGGGSTLAGGGRVKKPLSVPAAIDYYLKSRRQLGFALKQEGWVLSTLARYARKSSHRGPLT